jgi:hypothetical protein
MNVRYRGDQLGEGPNVSHVIGDVEASQRFPEQQGK